MGKFNDLYNMLIYKIKNRVKYHCDVNIVSNIPYWGELVTIEFRNKEGLTQPMVKFVSSLNGELDYGYAGEAPTLEVWMMRPDYDRCILELEKTIFILS